MNDTFATIQPENMVRCTPSEHLGEKRITVDIPNGWDDCKKICKRVLHYAGENYVFTGWNSDTNKAFFIRSNLIATIGKKVR